MADEPKVPPATPPEPKDDKKEPKDIKNNESDLDENELKSATSLYKALKDPDTANEIIESLARRAGLLDRKGDLVNEDGKNKKDIKEKAQDKIHKALRTKLGKDYEKFSDTIGPILDEAIQDYLKEHITKVDSKTNESKWSDAVDTFMEGREIPKKVENKMQELMEEAPPNFSGKTFNAKRYLERMYKNALEDLDMEAPDKNKEEEIKLPGNFRVVKRPEKVSTDDAIEAAMKGIRFK